MLICYDCGIWYSFVMDGKDRESLIATFKAHGIEGVTVYPEHVPEHVEFGSVVAREGQELIGALVLNALRSHRLDSWNSGPPPARYELVSQLATQITFRDTTFNPRDW